MYLNARYYDPKLTRFLSADNLIPSIYGPQSLNRYAYGVNDPVNFWDPSGHMPMRVERRKEIEARGRVASSCSFGTGGGDYVCSGGFEASVGEFRAGGTPVKLNAQGKTVARRVSVKGERGWYYTELGEWWPDRRSDAPLSPPPLVSIEEADAPYVAAAGDEWAPFPRIEAAELKVAFLADAALPGLMYSNIGEPVDALRKPLPSPPQGPKKYPLLPDYPTKGKPRSEYNATLDITRKAQPKVVDFIQALTDAWNRASNRLTGDPPRPSPEPPPKPPSSRKLREFPNK